MRKILGITGLLLVICVATALASDRFLTPYNIENLLRRSALFGILGIGVSFVIITGGIDLSIGSLVGLAGCLLPMVLLVHDGGAPASMTGFAVLTLGGLALLGALGRPRSSRPVARGLRTRSRAPAVAGGALVLAGAGLAVIGVAVPATIATASVLVAFAGGAVLLGLTHGLLITKLGLQPFVVTLCGLLFYRGLARGLTEDQTQGFGNGYTGLRTLATGKIPIPGIEFALPVPCVIFLIVAIAAAVFLNRTVWGRYLLALGRNEEAARLSGIDTGRLIVLAYVICAALSTLGGVLFVLDVNSAQPTDFGNFYELYAIAAAVLGGCSLRGGEGTITGVVVGAVVMQVLRNAITLLGIPTQLEFAIIGAVLLIGVSADQVARRLYARHGAVG